jgi:tetratricopeptide (TPR) repeat protein
MAKFFAQREEKQILGFAQDDMSFRAKRSGARNLLLVAASGGAAGRALPAGLALFLFSCPFSLSIRGQTAPPDLGQLSRQAMEAQRHGDYRGAATLYEQILQHQPHSPEIRSNLGLMHHFLGEYKEAVANFQLALDENPRLYVPNLFAGLDLLTLHEPQKALALLERACGLNTHDPQAQVGLGAAFLALGNREKARDAYERAVVIDSNSPDAWYGLGVVYLDLQKAAVDRLAETGRKSPYARDLVAGSLLAQGTPDAAVNVYRSVLSAKPTLPCLGADLGFAYLKSENFQSAAEAFQNEVKDHPGCLLAHLGLARLYLEKRETDQALKELFGIWSSDENFLQENLPALLSGLDDREIALLEDSCAKDSGSQQHRLFGRFVVSAIQSVQDNNHKGRDPLALVSEAPAGKAATPVQAPADRTPGSLLSQGRYTECSRSLRTRRSSLADSDLRILCECAYYSGDFRLSFLASSQLARYSSDLVPGLYWRARSSEKLAAAVLRQAGLVAPNSGRVHFLLAELYRQRNQEDKAAAEYLKALELQPNDLASRLGLADAYSMSTDFDRAAAELKRVFSLDPGQPDANYLMGKILVYQHRYAEAAPYLDTALKGNTPRAPEVHALISKVYASQGRTSDAISELQRALGADQDGSLHYELSKLYRKAGDGKAAAAALEQSRLIFQKRQGHVVQDTVTGPLDSQSKPASP